MISYELTEEKQIVQSTMSEIAREELFPHTRRLDVDACIDADLLAKMWSHGLVQAQADKRCRRRTERGGYTTTGRICSMISYELTEEKQIVQSTMSEFAREELFPHTRRLDDDACIDADLLSKLWSTGIVQAQADQEGRSPITNAIVLEELGAADATLAMAVASTLGFVGAIADQGSAKQREDLLKGFAGDEFQAAAVADRKSTRLNSSH